MPKILLLTHGGWGMKLVDSLNMILGNIDYVEEEPLLPQYTFNEYFDLVKNRVKDYPTGSLIITDLFGGTTTNIAAKIGKDMNLVVLTGLSAPLLLEACSQIMTQNEIFVDKLLLIGNNACKDVVKEILTKLNKEKN